MVFPVFSSVLSVEGLSGSGRRHLAVVIGFFPFSFCRHLFTRVGGTNVVPRVIGEGGLVMAVGISLATPAGPLSRRAKTPGSSFS